MKTTLTKAQRRMAIVKDAIAQVKAEIYKTGNFGYLELPTRLLSARLAHK